MIALPPVATLDRILPERSSSLADGEALVGADERISWRTFEERSARAARFLIDSGIRRGDRVAISLPKDVPAFVAVHAVVRAGAVVVPIDPFAGAELGRTAIEDSEASAFIGWSATCNKFSPWTIDGLDLPRIICVDDGETAAPTTPWRLVADHESNTPLPTMSPSDPAYIIYTSGSTGRPKGMLHTHASAMAYATRAAQSRELTPEDRVAGMSAFHFDMSTLELYAAPLAGSAVVIMSEAHLRLPASLVARTASENVTIWYTVPALLSQVTSKGGLDQHDMSALRMICFAGEPFNPRALNETMAAFPAATFVNVYGPAEVNECTHHRVDTRTVGPEGAPIGRTWDGVDHSIVDDDDRPVGIGEPGELLISAPTAMQGYWKRPDLNELAFVAREGIEPPWYRTGDIVVEDDHGVLWYRGRRDHQIKIRGARVELESVESVLADAPGVVHAVAGPDRAGSSPESVIAGVVLDDTATPSEAELRRWCAARLPAAAVPRHVRVLDTVPMTATGKVDRRTVRTQLLATADRLSETAS